VAAVLDAQGVLRAYAHAPVVGELGSFNRLLGHASHLDDGIMYLLISAVIESWSVRRADGAGPRWAMYDTFWGARPGLAEHKRRLGFAPHRVTWER
jgi:hypothetical protein